jgi:predicted dehydrogenase
MESLSQQAGGIAAHVVSSPLRVAVIGGGFGQQVHVPAFRLDGRARVDLLCVSTPERARERADRLGIPRASGDWRAVVADPQLDAVALSVPPPLQAELAIAAARAGKHVLAEKPLAMTAGEGESIIQALRASGCVGAIDFEFRELPAWQRARQLLTEGAIGRVRHAYVEWRVETFAYRDARPSWKRELAGGGGTLNLFASHTVDAVAWMLGPIARVAARLTAPTPGSAEARVDAWLSAEDGTPISLVIAADALGANEHRLTLYGEQGTLTLENRSNDYANGFTLTLDRRGEPRQSIALPIGEPGSDGRVQAVGQLVRRFIDAIVDGTPMTPSLDDGLAAQRVLDALREAHRTGTWQTLS